MNFSVCMSVYKNDKPKDFEVAVRSVYADQTVKPSEIIIVVDGPIPTDVQKSINSLKEEIDVLNVIYLEHNMGHAIARQTGLDAAKNDIIAIMDSDDISAPDRFEKQMSFLEENTNIDIVGGNITEFIGNLDNKVGKRIVPNHNQDIYDYLKYRCPFNLVTVMFRKQAVIDVGGFIDWYCEEDYYLWIRMALNNASFANLSDDLVNVRVGKEMYARRGGMRYFKSEARLQKYMFKKGIISCGQLIYNITIRFILQVCMPNKLRGIIFKSFARKKTC